MESNSGWDVHALRTQFPALRRELGGRSVVFLDGPAGSQVPQCVADAVSRYLLRTNANRGAPFATARESDQLLTEAHQTLADFLGATDPETVCFGANMTTITFQVSRALAGTWQAGNEIIVSRLDHDANFTPWVRAAEDRGVRVQYIELKAPDWTLDLDDFRSKLSDRTKLVAVGYAANATGTINPLTEIISDAHDAGALVYVDAVHHAPHGRIRVDQLGCDFLVCSAYKFFGPHVGVLWGRRELLEQLAPYKLRPAPDAIPGRWMTGTQCHEGIVGAAAAVDYLASLDVADRSNRSGGVNLPDTSRPARLDRVFQRLKRYEETLSLRMIRGFQQIPGVRIHGITSENRLGDRVPTVSLTSLAADPRTLSARLAEQGIFVWSGNHYALPFTESVGLEPAGTLRIGALHYNTPEEIDRAVEGLRSIVGG